MVPLAGCEQKGNGPGGVRCGFVPQSWPNNGAYFASTIHFLSFSTNSLYVEPDVKRSTRPGHADDTVDARRVDLSQSTPATILVLESNWTKGITGPVGFEPMVSEARLFSSEG